MSALRPSNLPKLAVCPCYESNPVAGPAAERGTSSSNGTVGHAGALFRRMRAFHATQTPRPLTGPLSGRRSHGVVGTTRYSKLPHY